MLPALDADGRLPPGRHHTTLDDIGAVFVRNAPFPQERHVVFDALTTYLVLVRRLFHTGSLWIDGGFVTHKTWAAPKDVDVVLAVRGSLVNALGQDERLRLLQLLTLQGVQVGEPAAFTGRVQPMGGLVDAFLVPDGNVRGRDYFHGTWSAVTDHNGVVIPGATKGYVEVSW